MTIETAGEIDPITESSIGSRGIILMIHPYVSADAYSSNTIKMARLSIVPPDATILTIRPRVKTPRRNGDRASTLLTNLVHQYVPIGRNNTS